VKKKRGIANLLPGKKEKREEGEGICTNQNRSLEGTSVKKQNSLRTNRKRGRKGKRMQRMEM